jgi:hypothetical protein
MRTIPCVRAFFRAIGFIAALSFALPASAVVPPPASPTPATQAAKLIAALEKGDYAAFIADGDATFSAFKQEQFESVAAQLSARLKQGYDISPLGELKKRGQQVTLWRIRFKAGGDDLLATLSMNERKVTGFWVN